ncbi:Hypothetical predicted protein [Cloeon dipterum]|uniref:Uncharacterized protein n=1 Tax=Cloeon dipterum TaxID=197152 RepID=A0A8S1DHD4_9INSE|nr:Hypothetical predicted protein [Cloeon dipterum]
MDRLIVEYDRLEEKYVKRECEVHRIDFTADDSLTSLREKLKIARGKVLAGEAEEVVVTEITAITGEIAVLTRYVAELKKWASKASGAKDPTEIRKVRTYIAYFRDRVKRLTPPEDAEKTRKNIQLLMQHIGKAYDELRKGADEATEQQAGPSWETDPEDPQQKQLNLSIELLENGDSDEYSAREIHGGENNLMTEGAKWPAGALLYMPMIVDDKSMPVPLLAGDERAKPWPVAETVTETRRRGKMIAVRDWKLKFDGDPKSDLSFAEFLREFDLKRNESQNVVYGESRVLGFVGGIRARFSPEFQTSEL